MDQFTAIPQCNSQVKNTSIIVFNLMIEPFEHGYTAVASFAEKVPAFLLSNELSNVICFRVPNLLTKTRLNGVQ